ncbi:MAG TPA: hypothetical protein VFE62_26130 [Gemmataceae bacterium]|nr:hypothetical protein [Gemmataceae bacterium]
MLFAEGGFLSDVTALIVGIASLIAAIVSLAKYWDERRKRKDAEHKLEEVLIQVRQLYQAPAAPTSSTASQPRDDLHDKLDEILQQLNQRI